MNNVLSPGSDLSSDKIADINKMVTLGAQERTEAEFRILLEGAGFKLTRLFPTPSRNVIEAVPV
jgi:hypothetical protein